MQSRRGALRSFLPAIAALCILSLLPSCGGERKGRTHMVPGLWQSDIDDLFSRLEEEHPDLYRITDKEDYEKARSKLVDSLAVWSDEKVIVELSRILAMAGDAGTGIERRWLEGRFRHNQLTAWTLLGAWLLS